jgi:hypothetical protein
MLEIAPAAPLHAWHLRQEVDGLAIDQSNARRLEDAIWLDAGDSHDQIRVSTVDVSVAPDGYWWESWKDGRELPVLSVNMLLDRWGGMTGVTLSQDRMLPIVVGSEDGL